jgi:Integral membrane protein
MGTDLYLLWVKFGNNVRSKKKEERVRGEKSARKLEMQKLNGREEKKRREEKWKRRRVQNGKEVGVAN